MDNNVFAVIDTNVIVSALLSSRPDSYPLSVMAHVYSGAITPVFNDEIIKEYRAVLGRKKFHFDPKDVESAFAVITGYGLNLERTKVDDEVFPDAKDIVFYEVKMSKEDAYLVTGNIKHFPKKPFVVTPREMVELLADKAK
jgi:Predicted nucleic acid-binding protein, contains PIN domain